MSHRTNFDYSLEKNLRKISLKLFLNSNFDTDSTQYFFFSKGLKQFLTSFFDIFGNGRKRPKNHFIYLEVTKMAEISNEKTAPKIQLKN